MRFSLLTSLTAAVFTIAMNCTPAQAETVVNVGTVYEFGSTFECHFYGSGESDMSYYVGSASTKDWTTEQINATVRALQTWDDIITTAPGRTLKVGVSWISMGSGTLAFAGSSYSYSYVNGIQQITTQAEDVWRNQVSTPAGGYDMDDYDIFIFCNDSANFYYSETPMTGWSAQYDYQSVILHEIGHGLGFLSMVSSTGAFETDSWDDGTTTTLYTTYDALLTDADGNKLIDTESGIANSVTLGETLYLGDSGLQIYNPSSWEEGSSLSHVTDDSAVMSPYLTNGDTIRMFSDLELEALELMGWEVIPEPSTATLSLLGLAGILLRRRRLVKTKDRRYL